MHIMQTSFVQWLENCAFCGTLHTTLEIQHIKSSKIQERNYHITLYGRIIRTANVNHKWSQVC